MVRYIVAACAITLLILAVALNESGAYERYNDGCQFCHGAFTDDTSTKGSIFPGDDKHTMHRSSQAMNAECDLCHSSGDGNDPFIGSSDGTANNPGIGCNGCHEELGLRAHHLINGEDSCSFCHNDPLPGAESDVPVYYNTPDSNVTDPCNPLDQAEINENWTIGDFVGTDNDGDNLYDTDDPDCASAAGTPGEVGALLVSAHDPGTGTLTIDYTPACSSTENNYYFGSLTQVATPVYSGQTCGIGNGGSYVWNYASAPAAAFFLVVGNDTSVEGSYGTKASGSERPEAAVCPESQDLTQACN